MRRILIGTLLSAGLLLAATTEARAGWWSFGFRGGWYGGGWRVRLLRPLWMYQYPTQPLFLPMSIGL